MFTFSYKWHIWIIISCRLIYTCTFLARFMKRWFYCCLLLGDVLCFGDLGFLCRCVLAREGKRDEVDLSKIAQRFVFLGRRKGKRKRKKRMGYKGRAIYVCLYLSLILLMFVCFSVCRSIYQSVYPESYPYIYLYICPHPHSIYICVCICVFACVCALTRVDMNTIVYHIST